MKAIDLTGKRALVTGGSQGIGSEICKKLASCGADIMINHFRSKEKAEALAAELRETYSVKVEIADADVSNSTEVVNLFTLMDKTLGGIEILVNNAGTESVIHVLDLEESEWDRVIDINLKGPFLCSQQAGRRMEKSRQGE
ncbi:MAG: SDR family NAD(P)-dependent oxidoreductase [Ignavibacteriales bacterium]|nr:SDR family NAD(P)-dependent oxidoreductase [Ignavibacteriales bacterium]